MELVFIEEISGISQKSNRPYHLIKLADPQTFENHTVSYDPNHLSKEKLRFNRGQKVVINGILSTPFGQTQFLATGVKAI